ncbi:BON domain-containing protein [Telmatobacter bradus]|uniref:BON domain-containing protein n=1 Tax=Telmatobacter bradus TaxID=474953 RepID=UPI003B42F8B6
MKRNFSRILAWGAVVVFSVAVAMAQDAASNQRSDGQIEMDVVHALDAADVLKNDLITAATIQGEVTLSGTVASDSSRKLAEQIVAKINGVSKVQNNLKVGDPQQAAADQNLTQPMQAAGDSQAETQQDQSNGQNAQPQQQYADQGSAAQQPEYPAQQPQYAQQQPYPQSQYPQQPPPPAGYAYVQPPAPVYRVATTPLTVPQGTLLALRVNETLDSKHAKEGQPVEFTVLTDQNSAGFLAIPRGATVHGVITEVSKVGRGQLAGTPTLSIRLTALELGGQSYPLQSDEFKVKGPNKAGHTVGSAFGGALLGAIIGGAAGGGAGAAIGAGVGAGAGTAAGAATMGPGVWVPAEARVDFHLLAPVTVNPVSAQEASRLAQGMYPGGPVLYGRPYPPPYGAPVYYYHPYVVEGGYYTWR